MRKILVLLGLALVAGCSTAKLRNNQLEHVAKDWSLVIRASQVIPVYPLTEDLQPGDVLLVSTPVEQQVQIYKQSGFLALDQMLVRLMAENNKTTYAGAFKEFYDGRYGTNSIRIPPSQWQSPDGGKSAHEWSKAPHAAFPTYQFSVKTGSGINLAIPIQGVPFALGLMNSGSANGTVTIADAYTYGLDNDRLQRVVRSWADQNRPLLRNYGPIAGNYRFLRVVSRVYVTGRVNVSVQNEQATGTEVAAGGDRPLDLLRAEEEGPPAPETPGAGLVESDSEGQQPGSSRRPDAGKPYNAMLSKLNATAAEQFGGRVKVATASSRAVTMSESFEHPLVVGYVGFDMPILEGGRLGAPISTLEQLRKPVKEIAERPVESPYRLAALDHMYTDLKGIQGDQAAAITASLDALVRILPETYTFNVYELTEPHVLGSLAKRDASVDKSGGFRAITYYLGVVQTSIEALRQHVPTMPRATAAEQQEAQQLERDLSDAQAAVRKVQDAISAEPALIRAIDFVFFGE